MRIDPWLKLQRLIGGRRWHKGPPAAPPTACPVPTNRAEEPCAIARGKRPCFCLKRLQKIVRVTGTQFVRSGPLCATSGTHWSNARRLIVFTARLQPILLPRPCAEGGCGARSQQSPGIGPRRAAHEHPLARRDESKSERGVGLAYRRHVRSRVHVGASRLLREATGADRSGQPNRPARAILDGLHLLPPAISDDMESSTNSDSVGRLRWDTSGIA